MNEAHIAAVGHYRHFGDVPACSLMPPPPTSPALQGQTGRSLTAPFQDLVVGLSLCDGQALLQPEYPERVDRDCQDRSFRGLGLSQNLRDAGYGKTSGFDREFVDAAAMWARKPKGRRANYGESVHVSLNAGINHAVGTRALEY